MGKYSQTTDQELRFLSENVGVSVSLEQAAQLNAFNTLLIKWTQRFNLVSVNTLEDSITRHVLDALSIGPFINRQNVNNPEATEQLSCDAHHTKRFDVLDIGSGAGLPVLPLAIAYPELSFVSVETNGKKIRFQRQVLMELGLTNVELMHERIESADVLANNVTSRAFTAPADFLETASHSSHSQTQVIVMLGQADGLPSTLPQPWILKTLQEVDVPGEFGARHVAVCIRGTLNP